MRNVSTTAFNYNLKKLIMQEKLSRKPVNVVKDRIDSHIDVSCFFFIFLAKAVDYDPLSYKHTAPLSGYIRMRL